MRPGRLATRLPGWGRRRLLVTLAVGAVLATTGVLGGAWASAGSRTVRSLTDATVTTSPTTLASADQVAISYVEAHYPGSGTARVLTSEADVDRGIAVYDVRTLAPSGVIYVVQVARSNNSVLFVEPAESQSGGPASDRSVGTVEGSSDAQDAPDHAPSSDTGTSASDDG